MQKINITYPFGQLIGKHVTPVGQVEAAGLIRDMFEMMQTLQEQITGLSDNDTDTADLTIDMFGLDNYETLDKKAFGRKVDHYLRGIDFSIYATGGTINKIVTMDNTEQLEQQLISAIETQLDLCDGVDTPTVCQMLSTKQGRQSIIKLISKKVVVGHMDITEAIVSIETEFNSNSLD